MRKIDLRKHCSRACIVALSIAIAGCAPAPTNRKPVASVPAHVAPVDPCPHPTYLSGDQHPEVFIAQFVTGLTKDGPGDVRFNPVYPLCGNPKTIKFEREILGGQYALLPDGRPVRYDDAHGVVTEFKYDTARRLTEIVFGDGPWTSAAIEWKSPTKVTITYYNGKKKAVFAGTKKAFAGDVELDLQSRTLYDFPDMFGNRSMHVFNADWVPQGSIIIDKVGNQVWSQVNDWESWKTRWDKSKLYVLQVWTSPGDQTPERLVRGILYGSPDDHGNPTTWMRTQWDAMGKEEPVLRDRITRTISYY